MDPNLPPANTVPTQQPKDLKTEIADASNEFVKDHYEGIIRKLMNWTIALLKFLKNSILSMINMALGRE